MKVSLNWLSDYLDLSAHTVSQLADLLTFSGAEVEGITTRGVRSDHVVTGRVLEFVPHPNADRLRLCKVDVGQEVRQIVCGAKNFEAGDVVPVALPGAVLPGDFAIRESNLRGVLSQGMMCSGRELGYSDDADGLMILPADTPVGRPLHELLEADTCIDLEITPNRPDLLSHAGIARELSALTGTPLRTREAVPAPAPRVAAPEEIRVDDAEGCPWYTARRIRGVKPGPSPDWLRRRLEAVGLRPINNIVDITNYVMLETGQPLHAFDAAKLDGGIVVRRAGEGAEFTALDERTYPLDPQDLVIADQRKITALAGVMGGLDTGVTDATTDVLLESAFFRPQDVRRTSRRLGLISDSSFRFERQVDPAGTAAASALAAKLITELAGGTADDVLLTAGAPPSFTGEVALDPKAARRLLGADIPDDEMVSILTRLGLERTGQGMTFRIPAWRPDLQRHADLVEEIARVYGIDRIPVSMAGEYTGGSDSDRAYDFLMEVRRNLAGQGFREAQTIPLISRSQVSSSLGTSPRPIVPLPVRNPISDDHTVLRPSLMPGLLAVAAHNIRHGAQALRFFETGVVFAQLPEGKVLERMSLAILLSGPVAPPSWADPEPRIADNHDLRNHIESLCPGAVLKVRTVSHPLLAIAAQIQINGKPAGIVGQLQPAVARTLDARHPVLVAELDVAVLRKLLSQERQFEELPQFPPVTRDVAMEVPDDLPAAKVEDFFASVREPLLTGARLFDVFRDPDGEKLAAGRKSLAYTLTYRDRSKTLSSEEVDQVHTRVLTALRKALPATIR